MNITSRQLAPIAAAVTWLPLAALSVMHAQSDGTTNSFWHDYAVHGRCLISVPLLILADRVCVPRLWWIVSHFTKAGLIGDLERFEAASASARHAFESRIALVALALAAWLAAAAITVSFPISGLPAWYHASTRSGSYSPAAWWQMLVSLPVALFLAFLWLWRLGVWTVLLLRVSRCQLRLVAAHPDKSGGLGFLGTSLSAFAPIAFGFSTVAASREAAVILGRHAVMAEHLYINLGFSVFCMLLIVLPLCAFTPVLLEGSRRGALAYGVLAHEMGEAFERRWLAPGPGHLDSHALSAIDFSATVDLYSIVAGTRGLRLVPVSRRNLLGLLLTLALPFVPVVLLLVPLEVILGELRGLLF
jgi:hypothetical protein